VLCVTRGSPQPLPEPIQRLERIEQALDALEDDFQPAGSISPEVELVFDEPNLFAEEFEEEEVIVDRYAPMSSQAVRAAAPGQPAAGPGKLPRGLAAPNVFCTPMPDFPASTPGVVTPGAPAKPAAPPGRQWDHEPETLPLRRRESEGESDDADMIMLEDGYDDLEPPQVRPACSVRKQEYRQLFARLRRG
jgi:hypothetical protein